jgi:ribosomal protein S18 acetylase RimI-like enzyme
MNKTRNLDKTIPQTIRDWFHGSFEGMGYRAERRRWGTYWSHGQVYAHGFPPEETEDFLADIRQYFALRPVYISIDDEQLDSWLGPLLQQAGCPFDKSDMFLAHVGEVPTASSVQGFVTEPLTESNLAAFTDTKLRAFADSEEHPDEAELQSEIERRRAELVETYGGLLARVNGEPAGVLGWYVETQDVWINVLATRLPFRHQGIGRALLCKLLTHAYAQKCRSVVINVVDENTAALQLYQAVGFTDVVSRRRRYVMDT